MFSIRKFIGSSLRSLLSDQGWIGMSSGSGRIQDVISSVGLSRPAENVLMVYACLMARREAIGGVPLRISDAEGNLIESGPIAALLEKPNGAMTWAQYIRAIESYSTLYDAIAIVPVRDAGRVVELIPLNPGYLMPVVGAHSVAGTPVVREWQYVDPYTAEQRTWKPDEIMVHQGFNPHAPMSALAPVDVLRQTMQQDVAARQMNLRLAANDATPPLALSTAQMLSPDQADEIQDKWQARFGGIKNRGKPAILWGGLKAEKISVTPAEMEYLAGLRFLRTDYFAAFRVAAVMVNEMMGETGLSQGSSTDSQKVQWWENTGLSELDLIADLHEAILGTEDARPGRKLTSRELWTARRRRQRAAISGEGRVCLWFDDNAIAALWRSRTARLDMMAKAIQLGYAPDDANDWLDLGLPPHPTNIPTIPMGVQPAADLGALPPPTPPPSLPEPPRALGLLDRLERALAGRGDLPPKWKSVRGKIDAISAPLERACAKKWSRYFLEQRDRVLARLKDGRALASGASQRAEDLDNFILRIFPAGEENGLWAHRFAGMMQDQIAAGWNTVAAEVGSDPAANPFTIEDVHVVAALDARKIQCSKANDTTEGDLRNILRDGIDEGLNPTEIGDRIAAYYDKCIGDKAARPFAAARTQVAGAVNDGRFAAARAAGNLRKGWLHGGSTEPRPAHLAAQARYLNSPIPMDAKFEINGHLCDHPHDTSLPAGEVVECTCMTVFSQPEGA